MDRRIVSVVVMVGFVGWASMMMGEEPVTIRLEPKPGNFEGAEAFGQIAWKDLKEGVVKRESSIMTEGYLPQALVLEKMADPASVRLQWRVRGAWFWASEEGAYGLGLPVHVSDWVNLHVAPEGWVLLPALALLEEAAGFPGTPEVEDVVKVLQKDYPTDEKGDGMAKTFKDQVKAQGEEAVMGQVLYLLKDIEIRFAEKGKEFPEEAQLVIHLEPGC
ncbi:hypothetical protein FEM03_19340 [Phragmitibacter flavus]|uniref:Uncharacterized protein n=1 Tax=Phragmitibacter flavus TaxID=2576071 RepID=A0A5R8KAT1_9BACT|nr:hypothetical protein FEM03_19340 [Phragmitibacter flavus]